MVWGDNRLRQAWLYLATTDPSHSSTRSIFYTSVDLYGRVVEQDHYKLSALRWEQWRPDQKVNSVVRNTESNSKMLKQSEVQGTAVVRHRESKARDAERSKGVRVKPAHLSRRWEDCKVLWWNGKAVKVNSQSHSCGGWSLSPPHKQPFQCVNVPPSICVYPWKMHTAVSCPCISHCYECYCATDLIPFFLTLLLSTLGLRPSRAAVGISSLCF